MSRLASAIFCNAVLALGALSTLSSCSWQDPSDGGCQGVLTRYYGDEGEFIDRTWDNFDSYDLETRYQIYICGLRAPRHPHWNLSYPLAEGGAETAQFLAEKLEETDDDLTIYHIIPVFLTMQEIGTFDARSDPSLMALIERKVSGLDDHLRSATEEYYLSALRRGPVTNPGEGG